MSRLLYFVCTSSRTGSSWLCEMLRSTGAAGPVREIRQKVRPHVEWQENLKSDPYGVKLNLSVMERLWPLLTPEEARTAKHVWLRRRDTWRQAISCYRAEQSGVWHVAQGRRVPQKHRAVRFNAQSIQTIRSNMIRQDRRWRQWFLKHEIMPLTIHYEELCRQPVAMVRAILGHLGIRYAGPIQTGRQQILRDDLTERWLERLEAEDRGQRV